MSSLFTPPTAPMTVAMLAKRIPQYRWPVGVELDFQNAIAAWLDRERINYRREYELGGGPIDFYFPDNRIGLELKVKGSQAAVLRQLQRYAQSAEIDAIVLLSSHAAHTGLLPSVATTLAGKPVHVILTWAGGL